MMMMICIACTVSLIMATQHMDRHTDLEANAQPSLIRHYSTQLKSDQNSEGLFNTNIRQSK